MLSGIAMDGCGQLCSHSVAHAVVHETPFPPEPDGNNSVNCVCVCVCVSRVNCFGFGPFSNLTLKITNSIWSIQNKNRKLTTVRVITTHYVVSAYIMAPQFLRLQQTDPLLAGTQAINTLSPCMSFQQQVTFTSYSKVFEGWRELCTYAKSL